MGDFDLSRQGQLQSRIPITAFFICIREKRKIFTVKGSLNKLNKKVEFSKNKLDNEIDIKDNINFIKVFIKI